MRSRLPIVAFALLVAGLLGNDACFYPRPQDDDSIITNPDARCAALGGTYPAGLAFDPKTSRLWVAERAQFALIPFDVDVVPPIPSADIDPFLIPGDSDSNGLPDTPLLEGIHIPSNIGVFSGEAGLVSAIAYDVVLFFKPPTGDLFAIDVAVPAVFESGDYPFLPSPGDDARSQTGISTRSCIRPPEGLRDSLGLEFEISRPCGVPLNSFYSSTTSGADYSGERLFVSVANPGADAQTATPLYLPGAVLAFELPTITSIQPDTEPLAHPSVIFTKGFNPTHVTGYSVGQGESKRNFVLVTVSGAFGVQDDPDTPDVAEEDTDSAIEVIDADTLELVATIPLGKAALSGSLAIDPTGRVAVVGSDEHRWLLAVDLEPLSASDFPSTGPPIELDSAVLHDAVNPIEIPALAANGAGEQPCPVSTAGVAYNHAGTRIYVTEFCDGTLSVVDVNLSGSPSFSFREQRTITGRFDGEDLTIPRGPTAVAVRPGKPGFAFTGPDVFVLVAEPEGLMCALDVESGSGSP
jgi:DNA-binding beta-propeller fold protein YncE